MADADPLDPFGFNLPIFFGGATNFVGLSILGEFFDGMDTIVIGLRFADGAAGSVTGFTARSSTIPEPATLALFGLALLGFGAARWWRKGKRAA